MGRMGPYHYEWRNGLPVRVATEFEADTRLESETHCNSGIDTFGVEPWGGLVVHGD